MNYQNELTQIHWGTELEEKEMYDLTSKMLNINNSTKTGLDLHYEFRARELLDGMLTAMAHDDTIDLKLSDVNAYVQSCGNANDLHLLLDGDLQLANSKNDTFLENRLKSCYQDFMTANENEAEKTFKALKVSLKNALNRSWNVSKDEKEFEKYFDKNSQKTFPYTLNFSTLDGFDACVRNFVVAQVKDLSKNDGFLDLKSFKENSPSNLAKFLFDSKSTQHIFLENLDLHIQTGDVKVKNDVERILDKAKVRDEALLQMAERRAAYLLGKTPFFLEQVNYHHKDSVTKQEISELCKELREKPYDREPAIVEGKNASNSAEWMYLRKARKFLFETASQNEMLYNKVNRILYRAFRNFEKHHMNVAKEYLTWQSNRANSDEIEKCCLFIRDHCFDRHHEMDREIPKLSSEEIKKLELEEHYRKEEERMRKELKEACHKAHLALIEKQNDRINSNRRKNGFKKRKDAGKDDDFSR